MCLRVYFGSNWYGAKPNYLPGYQSLALKKQVWVSQASEELQAKLILLYFASLEAVKSTNTAWHQNEDGYDI